MEEFIKKYFEKKQPISNVNKYNKCIFYLYSI